MGCESSITNCQSYCLECDTNNLESSNSLNLSYLSRISKYEKLKVKLRDESCINSEYKELKYDRYKNGTIK